MNSQPKPTRLDVHAAEIEIASRAVAWYATKERLAYLNGDRDDARYYGEQFQRFQSRLARLQASA